MAVCPEKNRSEAGPKPQAHVAEQEEAATFTFFLEGALSANDEQAYLSTSDIVGQGRPSLTAEQREMMDESLRRTGKTNLQSLDLEERPTFHFGNSSRNQCSCTGQFAVPMNGGSASLKIHALDTGKSPVLLSVKSLMQLGAQIDFASGLAVFHKVDPRKIIKLERTDAATM